MSKYEGTMNTRKQAAQARKTAIRRIEKGVWFKEFSEAYKEKDLFYCRLLYFEVANKNYPELKDWAKYKIAVLSGEGEETAATKEFKKRIAAR